jgi:hypothetical protein
LAVHVAYGKNQNIIQSLCSKCLEFGFHKYNTEYLPCLKYLLKLPQLQAFPMSQELVSIFASLLKYLSDSYITNKKRQGRIVQLLTLIVNSNSNITTMLIDTPVDRINGHKFTFKNSRLDCISYLLATSNISSDDDYCEEEDNLDEDELARKSETPSEEFMEFITTMFELGFSIANVPQSSVTALTILLGTHNAGFALDPKEFIERGVNVGSTALQFKEIKGNTQEQVQKKQEIKDTYCIPDALLLAYLCGNTACVKIIFDYCWFPPIFLLYFEPIVSEYNTYEFTIWYNKFHKFDIPLGSPLFKISRELISQSTLDPARAERDKLFISCKKALQNSPGKV